MEEEKTTVAEVMEEADQVQADPIQAQLKEIDERLALCDPEDDFEAMQKLLQLREMLVKASKKEEPKEEPKPVKEKGNRLPWAQLILGTITGIAGTAATIYGINTNREIAEMAYSEEKDMHLKNGTVWSRMLPKFFG